MTISNLTADQISALRTLSQSDGLTIREREALQTILKPNFRDMMENAPHGTAFKTVTVEGSDYWIIRTCDEAIRYASREDVGSDTEIVDRDGDDCSLCCRITFSRSDNAPSDPWCLPWLVTKDGSDVELRNSYSDELCDIFRTNRVRDFNIR